MSTGLRTQGLREFHRQDAWKPATFGHARAFVLDRDHDAECITCHKGNDYSA